MNLTPGSGNVPFPLHYQLEVVIQHQSTDTSEDERRLRVLEKKVNLISSLVVLIPSLCAGRIFPCCSFY